MQQTRTKEEKQELLQLYRQSGMSVRAFAEEFELNLGTFRNWLYKKPAKNIPADDGCSFVEVEALKVKQCMDSQNVRIRKNGFAKGSLRTNIPLENCPPAHSRRRVFC